MSENVKLVVFVPVGAAEKVKKAIVEAGGARIGNYTDCFFSVKGIATFMPLPGAHPAIGTVGDLEEVEEERLECLCPRALIADIVKAVRAAHPYEEPAIDIIPLLPETEL